MQIPVLAAVLPLLWAVTTLVGVQAQAGCISHAFNSGELLDAQGAGQCLDCARNPTADWSCWCTCPYMLYKAQRYGESYCEAGADYKAQITAFCAARDVCVSIEPSGVIIAGTTDELNTCISQKGLGDCGSDDNICQCTAYMNEVSCYDTYCPSDPQQQRFSALSSAERTCGDAEAIARASRASTASAAAASTPSAAAMKRGRFGR